MTGLGNQQAEETPANDSGSVRIDEILARKNFECQPTVGGSVRVRRAKHTGQCEALTGWSGGPHYKLWDGLGDLSLCWGMVCTSPC